MIDTSSIIMIDTVYDDRDKIKIIKTRVYTNPPAITPLPFGVRVTKENFAKTREFFADLESGHGDEINGGPLNNKPKREIKVYVLPHIKKVIYIPLPNVDTNKCDDGTVISNLLKFQKYQYRLPNMSKYQCYYFTEFDNSDHFSSKINLSCWWQIIERFYAGYLILYNASTQEAKVLKIYRDAFKDGMNLHTVFFIDKNGRIEIREYSAPSDENGDDPAYPDRDATIIVTVNNSGEVTMKTLNY